MIKSKVVKVEGLQRDITVTEVRAKRLLQSLPFLSGMFGAAQPSADPDAAKAPEVSLAAMGATLLRDCFNLQPGELLDLYSSDMEALWEAFKEVNGFFFKTVASLGVGEHLRKILGSILDGVGEELASSLKEDIRGALILASPGSSPPLRNPSESGEEN